MSREKSRQAAKDLLELCKTEGVKLPTVTLAICISCFQSFSNANYLQNARNAMIEAGTMLNSTKENVCCRI